MGSMVSALLKVCSKGGTFRIDRFTEGWKRSLPLEGPIARRTGALDAHG